MWTECTKSKGKTGSRWVLHANCNQDSLNKPSVLCSLSLFLSFFLFLSVHSKELYFYSVFRIILFFLFCWRALVYTGVWDTSVLYLKEYPSSSQPDCICVVWLFTVDSFVNTVFLNWKPSKAKITKLTDAEFCKQMNLFFIYIFSLALFIYSFVWPLSNLS